MALSVYFETKVCNSMQNYDIWNQWLNCKSDIQRKNVMMLYNMQIMEMYQYIFKGDGEWKICS